ncbi:5'-nucleotidase [Chlamydoabsidia padenii]|nr:5'-nucleotidase [Chlamydoabsidia padenii]
MTLPTYLDIIHFNDVYHVAPGKDEPVGGASRTDVLNALSINVACVGNHDFDFGLPQLRKLLHQCQFPWLISNVLYQDGQPPSPLTRWHVLNHHGLKIGVIGLVEKFPTDLLYHDFIEVANELDTMLRQEPYNVDLVIALTHMRVANDVKLARASSVDLILGGHDHFYYVSKSIEIIGDDCREDYLKQVGYDPEQDAPEKETLWIVKSGTDFREFGQLRLTLDSDPQGKTYIRHMTAIGYTTVPLDGRSSKVRTQETNFGNLTADLMLAAYSDLGTEIALCCGGTIRNDSVIEVGELTLGDIMLAFPFQDPVVVIKLTGQRIWDAIENSVSEYPKQEGRFPQVAGITVQWSSRQPPGQRVHSILVGDNTPLEMDKEYVVVTREYMALGYDGYSALKVSEDKMVVDGENGVFISTLFRRYFLGLKYINAFREHAIKHGGHPGHVTEPTKDYVDKLVVSIARQWHKEAVAKLQGDEDMMKKSLHGSQLGHPSCIRSEEEEDPEEDPESMYDWNDTGIKHSQQASWIKRWASISPVVQGRLVQLD